MDQEKDELITVEEARYNRVLTDIVSGSSVGKALSHLLPSERLDFIQNPANKARMKSAVYLRNLERNDMRCEILNDVENEIRSLDKETDGFLASPLVAIAKEKIRVIEKDMATGDKLVGGIEEQISDEDDTMIVEQTLLQFFSGD